MPSVPLSELADTNDFDAVTAGDRTGIGDAAQERARAVQLDAGIRGNRPGIAEAPRKTRTGQSDRNA